jgi:hypothetical protein
VKRPKGAESHGVFEICRPAAAAAEDERDSRGPACSFHAPGLRLEALLVPRKRRGGEGDHAELAVLDRRDPSN